MASFVDSIVQLSVLEIISLRDQTGQRLGNILAATSALRAQSRPPQKTAELQKLPGLPGKSHRNTTLLAASRILCKNFLVKLEYIGVGLVYFVYVNVIIQPARLLFKIKQFYCYFLFFFFLMKY